MTRTFIEMPWFTKEWIELGFDDDALVGLQEIILNDPKAGVLIKGTGGVRKLRFAFVGRGKSGSCWIIYVDYAMTETVFLLSVYQKSDKENLSDEEKNDIKKLVYELKMLEKEARRDDSL